MERRGRALMAKILIMITSWSGVHHHPNDTDEHTVFEVLTTKPLKVLIQYLDLTALVQNAIIRLYAKIDGTNYKEIDSTRRIVADRKGFSAVDVAVDTDFKLTAQSINAEGAVRDIPWRYITEKVV